MLGKWRELAIERAMHSFLAVVTLLAGCAVCLDFWFHGPLSWFVRQRFVVPSVEARWGFHAESCSDEVPACLYIVTEVVPGGPFDLAGVAPGYSVVPKRTGFRLLPNQDWFYDRLDSANEEVAFRLRSNPYDVRTETTVRVRIRPAT